MHRHYRPLRLLVLSLLLPPAHGPAAAVPTGCSTSVGGTRRLGVWPEAGNFTGLAAGDQICKKLAAGRRARQPQPFPRGLSHGDDRRLLPRRRVQRPEGHQLRRPGDAPRRRALVANGRKPFSYHLQKPRRGQPLSCLSGDQGRVGPQRESRAGPHRYARGRHRRRPGRRGQDLRRLDQRSSVTRRRIAMAQQHGVDRVDAELLHLCSISAQPSLLRVRRVATRCPTTRAPARMCS